MHPVVRIFNLIIFILLLSRANAGQLLLALILLLPVFFQHTVKMRNAVNMLYRMRWFFVSIFVLYVWMNPTGQFSFELGLSFWVSQLPSIYMGLERIFSLMLVILAVTYVISSLSQAQLLGAIYWLATPFVFIGLNREKLALRMVLTFNAAQLLLSEKKQRQAKSAAAAQPLKSRLMSWLSHTANIYHHMVERAETQACKEYTFEKLASPKYAEWLWPILLILLFQVSGWFYESIG